MKQIFKLDKNNNKNLFKKMSFTENTEREEFDLFFILPFPPNTMSIPIPECTVTPYSTNMLCTWIAAHMEAAMKAVGSFIDTPWILQVMWLGKSAPQTWALATLTCLVPAV